MYPCDADAEKFLVPIDETTPDYPGANQLKVYAPANPVLRDIAKKLLATTRPVNYDISNNQFKDVYQQFKIKAQMGCQIGTKKQSWAFGIHHCAQAHAYFDDELELLASVAKQIQHTLNKLLDTPSLINAAELSTEILDNSPLAQVIYNTDRQLVYANKVYCKLNERALEDTIYQYGKQYFKQQRSTFI